MQLEERGEKEKREKEESGEMGARFCGDRTSQPIVVGKVGC